MQDKEKVGKIVAGCGGLMFALCVLGGVGFAIMAATSGGRISSDEAMPGYLGSCCCTFISLLITVAGVGVFIKGKKDREASQG